MTTLFFQLNRFNSGDSWGFRLVGGLNYGSPLTVAQIVQGGQADRAGIEPGDQVTNIGGQPTSHMTHEAAQQAILRCGNTLSLQVFRKDCQSQFPQHGHHHHPDYSNSAHLHDHHPEKHRSHTQIYINDAGPHRNTYPMTPRNDMHACQHHGPMSPSYSSSPPSRNISNASSYDRAPLPPPRPYNAAQPVPRPVQSPPVSGGGIPRPFTNPVKTYGVTPERASVLGPTPKSSNASSRSGFPGISAPQPFSPPGRMNPPFAAPVPAPAPAKKPAGGNLNPRHRKAGEFERKTPSGTAIPMCHYCKTIIRGPFLAILDYCFCPDHFFCIKCNRNLEQCGFVENHGELYCDDDYAKYLAPGCSKCGQLILEEVVTALNKTWHPGCFLCVKCNKPLGEGMFRVGDDSMIYCEEDWMDAYQTRCDKCQTAIEEVDKVVEFGGLTMHARCFCCSACQVTLDGKKFVTKNGKPFCLAHAKTPAIF